MAVTLTNPNVLCSAATLAGVLGVTDRRVRQLVKDDVLKVTRSKLNGMHFRLGESVQAFVKHRCEIVSKQCGATNGEYEAARARRMLAVAKHEELALAVKQGEYLNRDNVGFCLGQMLTNCRNSLLAVPSKVMRNLLGIIDAREANRIVDDAIRAALTEASETKFRQSLA